MSLQHGPVELPYRVCTLVCECVMDAGGYSDNSNVLTLNLSMVLTSLIQMVFLLSRTLTIDKFAGPLPLSQRRQSRAPDSNQWHYWSFASDDIFLVKVRLVPQLTLFQSHRLRLSATFRCRT